ncbi:mechanosensitive ion channel family protein [Rhizobium sp. Root483D2]|uniref:mechanosensitive ion channel family protein n=1 Tax=Rhizobium sp. Root483D2 TaxID=1736545 RepID=UPI00138F8E8D|nr:mechanosensitive ion channel family protein [Rhizobium sp. Root483D2]
MLAARENATPVPLTASDRGMMSTALEGVNTHLARLAHSWQLMPHRLETVRQVIMKDIGDKGGFTVVALIALFVTVGAAFSYLAYHLGRPLRLWTIAQDVDTPQGRIGKFGGRFLMGLLRMSAFTVGSAGAFLLFDWPPLLREIVLAYLTAAIVIWAIRVVARVGLLPTFMGVVRAREVRAFNVSDARADHWYRWIGIVSFAIAIAIATLSLRARFGFTTDDVLAPIVVIDLIVFAIALLALWQRPVARAEDLERPGLFGHQTTSWLLTAYFLLLLLLRIGGANVAFWFVVGAVATPLAIMIAAHAVTYALRPPTGESDSPPVPAVTIAVVDRAIRLGIIVVAAYFLAKVWGLDLSSFAETSPGMTLVIRGLLNAAVVALGADFVWSIIKAIIQHKIGNQTPAITDDADAVAVVNSHGARLLTLLPILQNIMLAIILVMATLMILSSVGIQIAPLIAGAGVVGVAIGFGAQTIVKDVISGVFYLIDDAFRVGEHISTGKFSGTVESFSLRSVKLRHHRGLLYTIPFGELGAVCNGSRDWSTNKFNITVGFNTDLDVARKLIKRLGLELAEDPEYKLWVIEPIKLQGVQEFGEYGIVLRIKATTRPGGAFGMKGRFYLRVRELFRENGIEIPVPTVHIHGGQPGGQPISMDNEAVAAQSYLQRHKRDMANTEEEN